MNGKGHMQTTRNDIKVCYDFTPNWDLSMRLNDQYCAVHFPCVVNQAKIQHVQTTTGMYRTKPPRGYLVERWIRGCAAQRGCLFSLSSLLMAPF